MKPSRRSQPYRLEGGREPGPALDAMLRGRDASGHNPMDLVRATQRSQAGPARAGGREPRKPREPRKLRVPRS